MNYGNYTNFWNDIQRQTTIVDTDVDTKPKIDHIQLAGYRRAIGNFVNIVTNRTDIPVRFQANGDSYTDGKTVTIGSKIDEKNFDHVVGLALHEGSHILLSDFDFLKNLKNNTPQEIFITGKVLGFDENQVLGHLKNMLNYVEDRRIDYYIFSTSPGYKGYYHAMYDKYFHSKAIDKALKNNVLGNDLTYDNYEARIINFTNKNSDLDALPELRDIYRNIFSKVKNLKTMDETFKVAYETLEMIYDNINVVSENDSDDHDLNPDDLQGGGQGQGSGKPMTKKQAQSAAAEMLANGDYHGYYEAQKDIDNTDWSDVKGQIADIENQDKVDRFPDLTPQQAKTLANALEKQKNFLNDDIKKVGKLSKKDSQKIQTMEKAGVTQRQVGEGLTYTNYRNGYNPIPSKTNVIFVKKITKEMIDTNLFPSLFTSWGGPETQESVTNGISLGTKLGKRLQIRGESRDTKNTRLDSGRIDKRLIAELGFGNNRVFQHTFVEQYSDAILHISIDASGSMGGEKWRNTMTSVVAICKAASMIQNVDVVVSFRTTHSGGARGACLPLVAIGYDSRVNKFSHIKNIWPELRPGGTTPEGLCYEALMEDFVPSTTDRESYFLNFSDGMPMFSGDEFEYYHSDAIDHTRKQVKKILNKGIGVMSYFVGDGGYSENRYMGDFKKMYGQDSEFIDLTNVTQIANSMNKKFLEK
jgi:hypothetical protein